ncbi:MAG: hypothetical protein EZS28_007715 [Streblomastix strix]|uniref:Uncharacterized protein n=1 Tax=Streblomastix strix TaxID=222440 RepID=A0A5J4WQG0_9EUKA|nr:MAG: hypothetical protein EZS28_007715 [Streblomastix strix]
MRIYHCGYIIVGARTGIRFIGCPFSKNVKEFNKTGTVRAQTVCEFRHTKVHSKDTCHDRRRAIGDKRRDREVSLVRAIADTTRHRATTNSEAGGHQEDATANGKGLVGDDRCANERDRFLGNEFLGRTQWRSSEQGDTMLFATTHYIGTSTR